MSRKDYVAIARMLRKRYLAADGVPAKFAVEGVVYGLVDILQTDNALFDRTKFLRTVFVGLYCQRHDIYDCPYAH
jgi:hypothetical protein